MPPFEKPSFTFDYDPFAEIQAIRDYRDTEPGRFIPHKAANRLLLATWNIAMSILVTKKKGSRSLMSIEACGHAHIALCKQNLLQGES